MCIMYIVILLIFIKQKGETAKDLVYNWSQHHFSLDTTRIISQLDKYSDIAVSIKNVSCNFKYHKLLLLLLLLLLYIPLQAKKETLRKPKDMSDVSSSSKPVHVCSRYKDCYFIITL